MNRREFLRLAGAVIAAGLGPGQTAIRGQIEARQNMHTRRIAASSRNESLPVIGLGTYRTFDVQPERAAALDAVLSTFVELGGRLVDSSPMYGNAETVVGEIARRLDLRSDLFLATKVWTIGHEAGIEQMQASLRKLRTPTIDLLQVHNLLDVHTHLRTLRDWKEAGRVRYLGVTHYTAAGHAAVERLIRSQTLDFVQINYSVAETAAERRLLPLARERGVAIIANRPFAGGDLFARARRSPLPDWAAEIDCSSWAQLFLKFVVSHPAISCAIPATSKVAHLRDNMGAGRGRLPDARERARIAAAARS